MPLIRFSLMPCGCKEKRARTPAQPSAIAQARDERRQAARESRARAVQERRQRQIEARAARQAARQKNTG